MNETQSEKDNPKPKCKVTIIPQRCKGCGFCIEFCPKKVLKFSKTYSEKGYHHPVVDNINSCIGCNLCGYYCPDFAIWGEKLKEEK